MRAFPSLLTNTNTVSASLLLTAVNGDFTSPPGAAVQSIVSDSNYVYAATFGGGVFRKTATGNWAAINRLLSKLKFVQFIKFLIVFMCYQIQVKMIIFS